MRSVPQKISTHPDDQPALGGEIGQPVDVASMLVGVLPVLRTVVLDAHLPFRPAHVDATDEAAVLVDDNDLRLRLRKPGGDQQKACPGFLRRLGATVHQLYNTPQLDYAARPATAFGETLDILRLEAGSVRQRIDPDDRRLEAIPPSKIERRPRRRSHGHSLHDTDLVIPESPPMNHDPVDLAGLLADQLGR